MANIIFDTTRIMVYESLKYLAEATGKDNDFVDRLWEGLLKYEKLYEEFVFYLEHRTIKDELKVEEYSLLDLYVHRIDCYNIINDTGKNTEACNKESMILETFKAMVDLLDNPEEYIRKMNEGKGMDKL